MAKNFVIRLTDAATAEKVYVYAFNIAYFKEHNYLTEITFNFYSPEKSAPHKLFVRETPKDILALFDPYNFQLIYS
jgi:hypothetical protein